MLFFFKFYAAGLSGSGSRTAPSCLWLHVVRVQLKGAAGVTFPYQSLAFG